jgi:hypothetical protein
MPENHRQGSSFPLGATLSPAHMARTSWLFVSFGEQARVFCSPCLGSARNRPAGGSSDTCYPSISLHRPGASASSPPRVTKSDDEPTSFTPVGNSADSPQPILRPSPVTGLDPNIFDVEKTVFGL